MSDINYFYDVNGEYFTRKYKQNNSKKPLPENKKIIETLLNAGNKNSLVDSTLVRDMREIDKKINESFALEGMKQILSTSINEVTASNLSELNKLISLSNKMEFGSIEAGGDFTLSNFTQEVTVDVSASITSMQSIQTKVVNDISKKLTQNVNNEIKSIMELTDKKSDTEKQATNLGQTLGSLGEKALDTAARMMEISVGNSSSTKVEKEMITELKDTLQLDRSFELAKDEKITNTFENRLKKENIAKCVQNTNTSNEFIVDKAQIAGDFTIENTTQSIKISKVMNCAFNQEIIDDLATRILNDFDENISRAIDSRNQYLREQNKELMNGDIYAVGVAAKTALEGVGQIAKDIGTGVSTAAEGVGEGVSTASIGIGEGAIGVGEGLATGAVGLGEGISTGAQGVGTGISSAFQGMTVPFVIAGIVVSIIGAIVVYMKLKNKDGGSFQL